MNLLLHQHDDAFGDAGSHRLTALTE
ncbi:MAG: hypothetical protein CFH40_01963, partial [Alphaproteobacteria bacterium MarineAlpha10_Bin3]